MVRLTWTIQAANDLDSVKYARIQIIRIQERVKLLKYHPKAGGIISEIEQLQVRETLAGRYRIIYRFRSENELKS